MENTLPYNIRLFSKIPVTFIAYLILLSIIVTHNLSLGNNVKAHEIISQTIHNNTYTSSVPNTGLFFSKDDEQKLWDNSVKQRYTNGAILTVAPGIKHIKLTKYYNSRPVKINVIEVNQKLNENLAIKPSLASTQLNRKASIRTIAQKENAIAAVNGSFFKPQTGVPLGTMMIDGNILTGPIYNRVALGITNNNEFKMDRVNLSANLKSEKYSLKIDNINQPRMLSTYILVYTEKWGENSPPSPKYGAQIAILDNKIIEVSNGSIPIPKNGYVISGPRKMLEPFFNAENVGIEMKPQNQNWENVVHIISGGPYLIKNGEVFVDVTEEKLGAITGYNPRTAIGYTKDNKFIMVTVDGREDASIGMTLTQLAYFMKQIGCINAMNLDGGGSSLMYLNGNIINTPSVKGGIAISNALVIYEAKYETAYNK